MTIKRFGLDRDYANNIGVPAIIELPDGEYVRHTDYLAELARVEAMAATQTVTIAELWGNCTEIPSSSSGAPVAQDPVEWNEAERITDLPEVDEMLQGFSEDPTGDAGVEVVRTVLQAIGYNTAPQPPTSGQGRPGP